MKRTLALVVSLALFLGLAPLAAAEAPAPLFDEPKEFTIVTTTRSPFDPEQMDIFNEIERLTNVKLNIEWSPSADYDTKVGTILASGDLPDMIGGASIANLLSQGAIVPLDDYLETVGQDILAAVVPGDMAFWRQSVDGRIYTLPMITDIPQAMSTMVRTDWLERVGMDVPTTWDEWLAVWRAFRDEDANGDGDPKNEIPFALDTNGGKNGLVALMNAFGIKSSLNGRFCVLPDGTYSVVQEHPNYRAFLEAVMMMYSEGLLDREFATRTQADLFQVMDNNTLGSTMTWAERARLSTEVNREVSPEATWLGTVPVKGPLGDQMIQSRDKVAHLITVTVAAEEAGKAEDIVKFFNWFFTPEGRKVTNYGLEGIHHKLGDDGQPEFLTPYNTGFVEARKAGLVCSLLPFYWDPSAYMQLLTAGQEYEEFSEPVKLFYDAMFINDGYYYYPIPTYVTDAYQEYQAEIMTEVDMLRDKAISGKLSLDDFFAQYEALKSKGLQAIIDEGNEVYQTLIQ